ncbi:MAG: M23 family metallopeptidase [Proteobacteria bacterium]|nr:M23 family metallopeptidase [Pseudomonadota bacterium]
MRRILLYRLRIYRWTATASAIALLCSFLIGNDTLAQRRGGNDLGPEARQIIDNMSRDERREFRVLSRSERRAFIEKLLGNQSKNRSGKQQDVPRVDGIENKSVTVAHGVADLEGFIPADGISDEVRMMVGKNGRQNRAGAVAIQKARGAIETGLAPKFIGDGNCPEIDSEKWAIDYSHKRPWPAIHKGIDIPQPRGTPVRTVADGTVVGKFENEDNRKGIEVMLRHGPDQTGLPFWTYSQYTHLAEMSPLPIGATVKIGEEIGKTSNTGKRGRRVRRDALHFAILYSARPEWSNDGQFVAPKEGYWMDPNAFYKVDPPYDSQSLAKLPDDKKKVPVPYMKADGSFGPTDTKRIWPYKCD